MWPFDLLFDFVAAGGGGIVLFLTYYVGTSHICVGYDLKILIVFGTKGQS